MAKHKKSSHNVKKVAKKVAKKPAKKGKLGVAQAKAKKILKDGKVKGKKLTPKQRKFFGLMARGFKKKKK